MLRLYQPCLPTRALKPPTGKKWIHEIKHDGFRIVARRVDGVVRLQTKQGYDYAERDTLIVEAISSLKVSSIVSWSTARPCVSQALCTTSTSSETALMTMRRSCARSICWNFDG